MPPTYVAALRPDGGLSAEDNKLKPEDSPAHNWYRFVLSFPPHLVRQYIKKFGITASDRVLDPFCGTGTTLVECKKQGIPCVGIERNPLAVFASSVKINWGVAPDDLLEHAGRVADTTAKKLFAEGTSDYAGLPLWRNERDTPSRLRQLPPDKQKLILGNSISPLPLHKTLALLETLRDQHEAHLSQHEQLALARIHRRTGMDGVRTAEGGEGVTGAMIRARTWVDGRLAGGLQALLGAPMTAYSGCGEPDGGIGHGKRRSRTGLARVCGDVGLAVGSVADGRRQAGSGMARSRARARLNCSSQGQRRGRCRVNRRAERVIRPTKAKTRRLRVLVVTIC